MWNTPTLEELTQKLPRLRTTENTPVSEKIVGIHLFTPSTVYYMVEFCPKEQQFFGYTISDFDFKNAHWNLFSFTKLKKMKFQSKSFGIYKEHPNAYDFFKHYEIERNTEWTARKIKEIPYIVKAYKEQGLEHQLESQEKSNL